MKGFLSIFLLLTMLFSSGTYTDERDGRVYQVVEIDGHLWMAEDLKLETPGAWKPKRGFHPKAPNTRFYPYQERDKLCPEGWHILTEKEWNKLFQAHYDSTQYEVHKFQGVNHHAYQLKLKYKEADLFAKLGDLNMHGVGWVEGEKLGNRKTQHLWIHSEATKDPKHHIHVGKSGFVSHTHEFNITDENPKKNRRFAVRCVCDSLVD